MTGNQRGKSMCNQETAERIKELVKELPEDKAIEVLDFAEFLYQRETREDQEDIAIAEQRLNALQEGKSRTYTLDEVERDLGLED